MRLLHATSSAHLASIRKDGLRNPCLSTCEDCLAYYAEEAVEEAGGEPVIVEIEISPSMKANLRADYPSFEEPLTWIWKA